MFCTMSQLELFCTRFSAKSSTLLFCFIKDSTASQTELIFWSLVTHVVSIDSVACRSRSRISAIFYSTACETLRLASWASSRSSEIVWWNTVIFCSAACETSRLASWALSRSSETVWWKCRIVSLKSFSLVRLITASATMFTFSLSAASSSKLTSWFLRSVTMQRWSIPN